MSIVSQLKAENIPVHSGRLVQRSNLNQQFKIWLGDHKQFKPQNTSIAGLGKGYCRTGTPPKTNRFPFTLVTTGSPLEDTGSKQF